MRCSFLTVLAVATLASTATASRFEKRKNVDRPNPAGLEHCPGNQPGDADKCTFESLEPGPDSVITEIVGDPVGNCQGGTTNLKTLIGGSKSVSQTFKFGVSVGFGASGGEELPIGVSFSNSDSWSNTETKTFTQNIEVTIEPGKKVSGGRLELFIERILTSLTRLRWLPKSLQRRSLVVSVLTTVIRLGSLERMITTSSGSIMVLEAFSPRTRSSSIRGLSTVIRIFKRTARWIDAMSECLSLSIILQVHV